MLSVIIPARNEKYLEKTICSVLDNAEGEIEILAVLDGYIPEPQIHMKDNRVKFIHNKEAIGQRHSINKAAKVAKGKYIMKLDAHCAVAKGFDVILTRDCEYDMTMIPRMYNLDITTFKPKFIDDEAAAVRAGKLTDYMYIGWHKDRLRTQYYGSSDRKKLHTENKDKMIDETMSCMGPGFFMHKDRFWELGGCDEGHGHWGQQGIEVACKAWLSGGRLMVNKNTWFAHWFRGGGVPEGEKSGAPWPGFTDKMVSKARDYSEKLWLQNEWSGQKRDFQWLLTKFKPPTWEDKIKSDMQKQTDAEHQAFWYRVFHLNKGHDPSWRGVKMIKMPTDIVLYQEAIWEKKPDFVVEIGTAECGSALMMADFLEMTGKGMVISIDPKPRGPLIPHPRITYLKGDSKSKEIIDQVKKLVGDGSVMLSIDGDHHRKQVKWELTRYKHIVTKGQYMVVEDCYNRNGILTGPGEARDWFLRGTKQYKLTDLGKKWIVGMTKDSWLIKV